MAPPESWFETKSQHPSHAVRYGPYTRPFVNPISAKLNARFVTGTDHVDLPPYQYSEIKGTRHVRLMILRPAWFFSAPLQCELIETSLDAQPFEALSYVWGPKADLQPLLCDKRLLHITQNLDGALRFLRRKTRDRYLWVDAICINQDDGQEKEGQIPLMRELYTIAKHSLIWLGGPDRSTVAVFWTAKSMHLLTYLVHLGERLQSRLNREHPFEHNVKIVTRQVRLQNGNISDLFSDSTRKDFRTMTDRDDIIFLQYLLEREWFCRTWTIQELLLNKSALLVCGRHMVPAYSLARYVSLVLPWTFYDPRQDDQRYHRVQGQILLDLALAGRKKLGQVYALQLMMVVKSAAVTDAKDKVIGVQGILEKIGISLPPVTYAMPVAELYAVLTQAWIDHWNNLQILALAGSSVVTTGLPSWVPDWNNLEQADGKVISDHYTRLVYSQCVDSITKYNISATQRVDTQHRFAGIGTARKLIVKGHFTQSAVVHQVKGSGLSHRQRTLNPKSGELDSHTADDAWFVIASTVISWAAFLLQCTSDYSLHDVLQCLAAILNVGPKIMITMKYQKDGLEEDLRRIAKLGQGELSKKGLLCRSRHTDNIRTSQLWIALSLRSQTETLFMTNDGRLGLCYSSSVREADVLALVAGSELPLMLRKSAAKAGCYSLVGLAVLSDLPGAKRRIYKVPWEERPDDQLWYDLMFTPRMPADASGKGSVWNRFDESKAVVSGLMRGELWQELSAASSLVELTLI